MKDILLNLEHGDDTKISLEIKGIDNKGMEKIVKQVFSVFIKKIKEEKGKDEQNPDALVEKAYMDLYCKKISENNEPEEKSETKGVSEPTTPSQPNDDVIQLNSNDKDVKKVDTPKTMEELLEGVDPRTYRNHGGVWRFQVYYICEKCRHKGRAFVEQRPTFNCRECGYTMKLIPATDKPFPFNDEFGNFYVAGKYRRSTDYSKIIEEKPDVEQNVYQFKLEKEMVESDSSERSKKLQVK